MRKFSLVLMFAFAVAAGAATAYHQLREIKIGGEGGWDYITIDSAARRLYVSHATHVVVVDPDLGKIVGDIPDTQGVHGIALAPDLNRGFTSNGRANNVTIFDLKSLKVLGQVKTGENPDAIRFEPVSGRVFTLNGRSKDSTAIDAKTGMVDGTIPLGGKPEFAVADGKGKIYVNMEDTNEIAVIDGQKLAVAKKYSIKPCDSPSGLAIDVKNRRLFSVCDNKIMVISDPDTGKVLSTVPIGQSPDAAGFDASRSLAFSSNGDGTLTVVRAEANKWEVIENDRTQKGARTMAVDEMNHDVYLPTAEFGPPAAATAQSPRPRPTIIPDTFKILVFGNE